MMKRIVFLLGLFAADPALAQTRLGPSGSTWFNGLPPPIDPARYLFSDGGDTPTMRQQRLAWAIALRDQALQFQAEDGGVLSDQHARYIRRRINRIRQ